MAIELQIQEEDRLTLEVESEGSTLLSSNETYRSLVKDYNVLTNKPVLNTDNDESLTPDESEVISGMIDLHKVSKTGDYGDLQNAPEYDPDTGNLSSTKFTGSGEGLTDIPSSAVDFDDLPVIGDYEGPSGTGRFVTFLQNESGDTYTNPYLLDLPVAMMYRVKTDSITMNNGLGIGRQKLGIACTSARYTGSTNTLFCFIAETPIEIDTTTYAPISELITDNIKLGFRLLGSVIYDDNSESVIDTHVVISYNSTSGWFASYNIFGNRNFGISLSMTFAEGKLSIIVGPAALQNTFEDTLSNFKVFRYCNLRIDYMGSSTGDYPSGKSDLSGLIEPSSGWSFSYYQHNNTQTWNDAISTVQPNIFGVLTDAKEDILNKVTTIGSSSTNEQYPSAKAVYDKIQASVIRVDDSLSTTSTNPVQNAVVTQTFSKDAYFILGKSGSTFTLTLHEVPDSTTAINFGSASKNPVKLQLTGSNNGSALIEQHYRAGVGTILTVMFADAIAYNNKYIAGVSFTYSYATPGAFTATFYNVVYPWDSSKFSSIEQDIDELSQNAEYTSNKVTSISSTSTNDEYPSAKAVYDALPNKTSDLTNDSGFVDATQAANAAPVKSVNGQTGAVVLTIPTVPTNVSAFTNDAGYLTLTNLPIYNGGVQ